MIGHTLFSLILVVFAAGLAWGGAPDFLSVIIACAVFILYAPLLLASLLIDLAETPPAAFFLVAFVLNSAIWVMLARATLHFMAALKIRVKRSLAG